MRLKFLAALVLPVALLIPTQSASACPPNHSRGLFGWCYRNFGGDVARTWDHVVREVRGQLQGNPLAVYLQQSRDSARPVSEPLPAHIRNQLNGIVRSDVLDQARFKVGDNGVVNAAALALGLDGNVAAVALVDVIVFRNAADVQNNLPLWVHELTHVRQFKDWGVRDFAIRYSRNKDAVEGEADGEENRFTQMASSRTSPFPGPNRFPGPSPFPGPFPPPMPAAACYTPMGPCAMAVPIARGSPCYCPTMAGAIWGQAQ